MPEPNDNDEESQVTLPVAPGSDTASGMVGSNTSTIPTLRSPPNAPLWKAPTKRSLASLLPGTVTAPKERKAFRNTIKPLYFFSDVTQTLKHTKRPLLGQPKKKRVLLIGYKRIYLCKHDAADYVTKPLIEDIEGVVQLRDARLGVIFARQQHDSTNDPVYDLLLEFPHVMLRDEALLVILKLAVANLGVADAGVLPTLYTLSNGGAPEDILHLSKDDAHIGSSRGEYLRRLAYPQGVQPAASPVRLPGSPRLSLGSRSRSLRRQSSVGTDVSGYSNIRSFAEGSPRRSRRGSSPPPPQSEGEEDYDSPSRSASEESESSWGSPPSTPASPPPGSPTVSFRLGSIPRRESVYSQRVTFGKRRSRSANPVRSGSVVSRHEYDGARRRCKELDSMVCDLRRELGDASRHWSDSCQAAHANSEAVRQQCEAERLLALQQQVRMLTSQNAALQSENTSLRLQLSHASVSTTLLGRQAAHLRTTPHSPFYNTSSPEMPKR